MSTSIETTSAELLEKARLGDPNALEQFLRLVQPQIYRFGMKMCRHVEDAEDVLQETLMSVARSLPEFRGTSSMSTWLYTIARNSCVKKRRKSKFAPKQEESLEVLRQGAQGREHASEGDPRSETESKQSWAQVAAAIELLEPAYREVLLLRDMEGLSAKEVAEVTGLSVAAVKSRLHRARSDLRGALAPQVDVSESQPGCVDIRSIFSQFTEGELSSEICSTMEAHVAGCSRCAAECKGLNDALHICRAAPAPEASAGFQARLDAALHELISGLH